MSLPQRPRHFSARPFLRTLLSPSSPTTGRFRLKSVIATVTTMLLALGVVTVGVAAPANANQNAITAAVSCTPYYTWQVTWSVANSMKNVDETITTSSDEKLVPLKTVIKGGEKATFTEILAAPVDKTLTLGADWANGTSNTNTGTLSKARFTPACVAPAPTPAVKSTGLYLYQKTDPTKDASWPNSGPQIKIATWDGWSYKGKGEYPAVLPSNVCGTGWGVQQDQINGPQSLFPDKIQYPNNGGFASGVLKAARHDNLTSLIAVPACATVPVVVPPTPKSTIAAVCTPTGPSTDVFVTNDFNPAPNTVGASFEAELFVNGVLKDTLTVASGTVTTKHYDFAAESGEYTVVVKVGGKTVAEKKVDSACALATDADPTPQACVNNELVNGQIRVLLNPRVVYKIDGTVVTAEYTTVTPGSHTVTATLADPSGIYVLSGPSSWTLTTAANTEGCELPPEALVVPTVTDTAITCEAGGSYTLSDTEGVVWTVDGVVKPAGTYSVTETSVVHVDASTASSKYGFAEDTKTEWPLTFTKPELCVDPPTLALVTPTAASTAITCTTLGSYTLGAVDGVTWLVDGVEKAAGTYPVASASTVRAVATVDPAVDGFEQGAQTSWTFDFASPADCGELVTHPLVAPIVTQVNRTCTTNGSYTLTAVDGVVYTANGTVQAAGTYPVSTARSVNVVASVSSSDFGFEEGVPTSWTLVFTDPGKCGELTTLAFTGPNGSLTSGLLLGLLFLLFGAGVMTASRIRKRTS
ncbi:MAG: hypothetical protein V4531_07385 [Actinomycetota bacterium]